MRNNSIYLIDTLVNQISSFIGDKKTSYISVPITTGIRFIEWYQSEGKFLTATDEYTLKHKSEVIEKNIIAANRKIEEIQKKLGRSIINPSKFDWPDWDQSSYQKFWDKVLEKYIDTIIFIDGWQYSNGCCFEYLTALKVGINIYDERLEPIALTVGYNLLQSAILTYDQLDVPAPKIKGVFSEIEQIVKEKKLIHLIGSNATFSKDYLLFKDEILDRLADVGNVAQFISYAPEKKLRQRFLRINSYPANFSFKSPEEAISRLIEASSEKRVNVRSFDPRQPKGNPFEYGLTNTAAVLDILKRNTELGLYSIVNETIDINDGGVSGVALGNIIEFTVNDTPKGVDKPGVCRLPRKTAIDLLKIVYGFSPKLSFDANIRVEFSLHPVRRGIRQDHTIIWELEEISDTYDGSVSYKWPNNFSRAIGDKAFGLLIANLLGTEVPYTTVISRQIAPFSFGYSTGTNECWLRTAPFERTPGKFSTFKGWRDPFKLLHEEDPTSKFISSVLSQESVPAIYSGSLLPMASGELLIEGTKGHGDLFMVGQAKKATIPAEVLKEIKKVYDQLYGKIGPVELEWAFDGHKVWVLQLHASPIVESSGNQIVPGTPATFISFNVSEGLEKLRELISELNPKETGVKLIGDVGITSHFGDILRKSKIPSYISAS